MKCCVYCSMVNHAALPPLKLSWVFLWGECTKRELFALRCARRERGLLRVCRKGQIGQHHVLVGATHISTTDSLHDGESHTTPDVGPLDTGGTNR